MPNHIVRRNGVPEHDVFCDCLDCRVAWEEWHEAKYRWRLAQAVELRHAKPATDEEWAAFMDAEYPQAKEGVS
jgi:hypothetical protein